MRTWLTARVANERGIALPTAMILLVILMALTFAFSSLGTSEPVIARNHSMSAQARAFAESGLERALWAMNNATPVFTSGTAAAPYNGNELVSVSAIGGFTVRLTESGLDRHVVTVGWAPDNTGQLRAARKIQATLSKYAWAATPPLCALCVTGTLQISGNATIDSRSYHCSGTTPIGGTASTDVTVTSGAAHAIYGPGDNVANGLDDIKQAQSSSVLPKMEASDLALLKSAAIAAGNYYQGAKTFKESCNVGETGCAVLPPSGGIVFVDTTTGNDLVALPSPTPPGEMGNVTMSGNQTWSGWLIAMGDITITGTVALTGGVYARNDFVFNGNGSIRGAVATGNKIDTVASSVDSTSGGSSTVTYDCEAFLTAGGTISNKWFISAGTYREIAGQ